MNILTVAFFTLGCKVNQYETEVLAEKFIKNGFTKVNSDQSPDIFVVNSCTVTSSGDKKTRQTIKKFKKENPSSITILTGCFPQAFPEKAKDIKEADIITGSYNRNSIIFLLNKYLNTLQPIIEIYEHKIGEVFEPMSTSSFSEKTRAFIKIQDGCNQYCTYCIIPKARGFLRSKNPKDTIDEITTLGKNGFKEIVLVGINLSLYQDQNLKLIDIIKKISEIDYIKRIRLGSIEPDLMSKDDIIELSKLEKFCPQFHLSIQSGCDKTLKNMKRLYTTKKFEEVVYNIRTYFTNPSITTDIMVGFPNETDSDFLESLNFAEKILFAKSHVFPYSIREGTLAANMNNQLSSEIKHARCSKMIEITNKSRKIFLASQIGKVLSVLFEKFDKDKNTLIGYSKNYTPVIINTKKDLSKQILDVKISDSDEYLCFGDLI